MHFVLLLLIEQRKESLKIVNLRTLIGEVENKKQKLLGMWSWLNWQKDKQRRKTALQL